LEGEAADTRGFCSPLILCNVSDNLFCMMAWLRGQDLNLGPLRYEFGNVWLNQLFCGTHGNFEEGSGRH